MSHIHMFFNFIRANCKRLLHYLPSMFVSLLLLLLLTGTAGFYLSRHLYKENVFSAISIGYYLPQDDNLDLNQLGIGIVTGFRRNGGNRPARTCKQRRGRL